MLDGTVSPDRDQRMLDLIFGLPGACETCLPRRTPAVYEVWISVLTEQTAQEYGEGGPFSWRQLLCAPCASARRQLDVDEPGDGFVAIVRDLPMS